MELCNYSVSHFLKRHLEKIQEKNRAFSLRAMAQKIEMSPGGLTQIVNGKKRISLKRAYEVSDKLKLNKKDRELFLALSELEQAENPQRKSELIAKLNKMQTSKQEYFDLEIENFKLISEWYGFAILECVSTYGSTWKPKELAVHFGLKVNEVKLTLERLKRLELIEKNKNGHWNRVQGRVISNSLYSNEVATKHYLSSNAKSNDSLTKQNMNSRITGTEYFSINKDDLEQIRELTYKYLDDLQEIASNSKNPDSTYETMLNIFNLTNNPNNQESL